ncbi:MAG: tetratricopeptide repeat protein [Planctomycetes bacterium]|nr:tetratricopeptide repeat protein [Planctomycetota bacterium]
MHAEDAYLFRHALLRDAAYQIQLPLHRARLHALALELIERVLGGRPELRPLLRDTRKGHSQHPTDIAAVELAIHAREASWADPDMIDLQRLYLQRAARHAAAQFRGAEAAGLWAQLSELLVGVERAEALRLSAVESYHIGLFDASESRLMQALRLAEGTHEPRVRADLQMALAGVHQVTGRAAQARQSYDAAIEIAERAGELECLGMALGNLAAALSRIGNAKEAEPMLHRALALHRELGNDRSYGITLANLGLMLLHTGRAGPAEDALTEALAVCRQCRDLRTEGAILVNLGVVYQRTNRPERAEAVYLDALRLLRETGLRGAEAITLGQIAILFAQAGRHEEAEREFVTAVRTLEEIGDRIGMASTLGDLGVHYFETGRLGLAADTFTEAIRVSRAAGDRRGVGVSLGNLAHVHSSSGDLVQADNEFREALAIHAEIGNRRFTGVHTCEHAICLLRAGQADAARRTWRLGHEVLSTLGDVLEASRQAELMRRACIDAGIDPFDIPEPGSG